MLEQIDYAIGGTLRPFISFEDIIDRTQDLIEKFDKQFNFERKIEILITNDGDFLLTIWLWLTKDAS